MAEAPKQRLFFALWPDPDQRQALLNCFPLLEDFPGRRVEAENLHLTLAFLGNVDAATQECLEQATSTLRLSPFSLTLNRFGYWKKPKVIWYGASEVPEALDHLVTALEKTMGECGLQPESRPYRPHVTLLRKAQHEPEVLAPEMVWYTRDFVLAVSESTPQGVRYRVLRRWDLKS